jgi:hypothetical protein
MERSTNGLAKLDRMNKTLCHEEPDRVPISDFFWQGFLKQWREINGLSEDADINRWYDLDYVVTLPNTDPKIRSFEVLKSNEEETVLRTGFGALIRKKINYQMPEWLEFETDTIRKINAFEFDDPWDDRRFFSAGDHQIAGIEEEFTTDIPPWIESVKELWVDFPLYGSVCEGYEMLWRIIGSENALLWIGLYPDEVARFVERINTFSIELLKAQIMAADGMLDGVIIWGDVAFTRGMLFSPEYWRKYFKPGVKAMIDVCHDNGLPVIYHGCGNVMDIFDDFIEMQADAYNPLEAKAGLDVVELRRKYGHSIAFSGNMDVIAWAHDNFNELKSNVLRKLNAAKGGGFIFQSDNSVPDNVTPQRYEYVINLVREYGTYPLNLGEYDIPEIQ